MLEINNTRIAKIEEILKINKDNNTSLKKLPECVYCHTFTNIALYKCNGNDGKCDYRVTSCSDCNFHNKRKSFVCYHPEKHNQPLCKSCIALNCYTCDHDNSQ